MTHRATNAAPEFMLVRRTGASPLYFRGETVFERSVESAGDVSCAVRIHMTTLDRLVVETTLARQDDPNAETRRAWSCAHADAAIDAIAGYDPTADADALFGAAPKTDEASALGAIARASRVQRLDAVRRGFQAAAADAIDALSAETA
ncbi:MAG: hypothetical protein ACFB00_08805 [Parvularculaceae bacterium]